MKLKKVWNERRVVYCIDKMNADGTMQRWYYPNEFPSREDAQGFLDEHGFWLAEHGSESKARLSIRKVVRPAGYSYQGTI